MPYQEGCLSRNQVKVEKGGIGYIVTTHKLAGERVSELGRKAACHTACIREVYVAHRERLVVAPAEKAAETAATMMVRDPATAGMGGGHGHGHGHGGEEGSAHHGHGHDADGNCQSDGAADDAAGPVPHGHGHGDASAAPSNKAAPEPAGGPGSAVRRSGRSAAKPQVIHAYVLPLHCITVPVAQTLPASDQMPGRRTGQ